MAAAQMRSASLRQPFASSKQHSRMPSQRLIVRCSAQDATRRSMLIAGGAALVSPLVIVKRADAAEARYLPVENLSAFQKSDERQEFKIRAESVLKEVLAGSDAPACIRMVLHDAGTYDVETKTGGFDGSIILSDELNRPENSTLKEIAEKLKAAKKAIDDGDKAGAGPISYADVLYLAGKVATQKSWKDIKIGRSKTTSGGNVIANNFQNPWEVRLGRQDSSTPGPAGKVPALDADVEVIRQYLLSVGAKPGSGGGGPFSAKPLLWERPGFVLWTAAALDPAAEEARFVAANPVFAGIKRSYDISRETVTRTDYEVDFANFYNKLTSLGAKFNETAYLYPVQLPNTRI